MLFHDRTEAGKKLAELLKKKVKKIDYVLSLLRGGAQVGAAISSRLKIPHLLLPVAKISSLYNPELAIGALCFDKVYFDSQFTSFSDKKAINQQIKIAKIKFSSYLKRFHLKKTLFKNIKNKTVILVDDGIATGATVKAALLFVRSLRPKDVVLACPVAASDFDDTGFDRVFILYRDPLFSAVSQFYKNFPQVEDEEILRLLRPRLKSGFSNFGIELLHNKLY